MNLCMLIPGRRTDSHQQAHQVVRGNHLKVIPENCIFSQSREQSTFVCWQFSGKVRKDAWQKNSSKGNLDVKV